MPTGSGRPGALVTTILLLLAALGLRLGHVADLQGTAWEDDRTFLADAQYYDLRGREIAGGDLVGDEPGFLSPVYCFFVGAVYAVLGPGLLGVKVVQAVLGALSVALVHRAALRFLRPAAAAVGAGLLVPYGVLVYYGGLVLPTTLVLFWHALLLWILARRPPLGRTALAAGCVVGLAVGTKANALLLVPAISAWILLAFRERTVPVRLAGIGLLVLGAALAVAPVTWRNWASSGHLVLVTTTGGRNLAKGNGPQANGTHTKLLEGTTHIAYYLEGEVDADLAVREDRALRNETVAYALDHPWRTLRLVGKKILLFFDDTELGIRDDYEFARTQTPLLGLCLVGFSLVAPLGLAGLLLHGASDRRTALLALLLATQVVSFAIVFVLARYRVVAVAVLALFAGAVTTGAARDLARRRWKRPLAALLLAAVALGLVRADVPGFEEGNPHGEQLAHLAHWHRLRGETETALKTFLRAADARWALDGRGREAITMRVWAAQCLEDLGRGVEASRLRREAIVELRRLFPDGSRNARAVLRTLLREKDRRALDSGAARGGPDGS